MFVKEKGQKESNIKVALRLSQKNKYKWMAGVLIRVYARSLLAGLALSEYEGH